MGTATYSHHLDIHIDVPRLESQARQKFAAREVVALLDQSHGAMCIAHRDSIDDHIRGDRIRAGRERLDPCLRVNTCKAADDRDRRTQRQLAHTQANNAV
jgi:hypothetical protein